MKHTLYRVQSSGRHVAFFTGTGYQCFYKLTYDVVNLATVLVDNTPAFSWYAAFKRPTVSMKLRNHVTTFHGDSTNVKSFTVGMWLAHKKLAPS